MTTKQGPARIGSLVQDAVQHGAELVLGGKQFGDGYHFEPTLLVGASPDAQLYNEEIFGPVVSVYPFESEDEVSRV
jgi:succinate-semialdehyde dehydrogenase/glutarate-semialdehyde dehydrogenase